MYTLIYYCLIRKHLYLIFYITNEPKQQEKCLIITNVIILLINSQYHIDFLSHPMVMLSPVSLFVCTATLNYGPPSPSVVLDGSVGFGGFLFRVCVIKDGEVRSGHVEEEVDGCDSRTSAWEDKWDVTDGANRGMFPTKQKQILWIWMSYVNSRNVKMKIIDFCFFFKQKRKQTVGHSVDLIIVHVLDLFRI